VTPPIFEAFLTVLMGELPCIIAGDSNGLKPLALEFKCDRLWTEFNASPDGDYAHTEHENVVELPTHVSDLPVPETDESLPLSEGTEKQTMSLNERER
jgi:hypothetical protein